MKLWLYNIIGIIIVINNKNYILKIYIMNNIISKLKIIYSDEINTLNLSNPNNNTYKTLINHNQF